jgi:hypothetical protein
LSKGDKAGMAKKAILIHLILLTAIIFLEIPEVQGLSALQGNSELLSSSDLRICLDKHNQIQIYAKTLLDI